MQLFEIIELIIYWPKYLIDSIISKHLNPFHHLFSTKKELESEFMENKTTESSLENVSHVCWIWYNMLPAFLIVVSSIDITVFYIQYLLHHSTTPKYSSFNKKDLIILCKWKYWPSSKNFLKKFKTLVLRKCWSSHVVSSHVI